MREAAQATDMDDPAGARKPPGAWRRRSLIAAKIAVSAGLLAWALIGKLDLAQAGQRVAAIPAVWLALALGGSLVSCLAVAARWRLLLRAQGIRLGFVETCAITWIGLFFNQTLPANLAGDVVRVWRVRRHGQALGRAVSSVMIDRVVALVALALLVTAGLPLSRTLIGPGPAWYALVAIGAIVFAGLGALLAFDRVVLLARRFLPGRAIGAIAAFGGDARAAILSIRGGAAAVTLSVANFVLVAGVVWALAVGLGIAVRFLDMLVLFPPVLLVSMLPVSFAGWGVREIAMIAALGYVGVPDGLSVALSLAYGLTGLASALPGGLIWFATGDRHRVV